MRLRCGIDDMATQTDFLIIGGGIIGISVAREIKHRYPDASVILLEKEDACARHASGRNSGVLHAGFYYTADSLKARFTRDGNRELTEYCDSYGIPINKCGKLVVVRNQEEDGFLDELLARAKNSGVQLQEISAVDAREIEPRASTWRRALFSPTTSTVNPIDVVNRLMQEAKRDGVQLHFGERYLKKDGTNVFTTSDKYQAGYTVNAAGLYADRVARDFGFSDKYRILPFKGLYLYSDESAGSIRTNVYPVPDLRNPFLGVHFTVTVDGHTKIGPTAVPAFWREHYEGIKNFQPSECLEIVARELSLLANSQFDFMKLAFDEIKKYSRSRMVDLAAALVQDVDKTRYKRWGRPGIRAQLVDIDKRKLEMDFVIEGDNKSLHVLNAVSPAFTCSLPFARHLCDTISNKLS